MLTPPEVSNRLFKPGGIAEDLRPPLWAWKARWSQRFFSQVPIVVMGDSIEFGSNTAGLPEYTWVGRLGYILRGDRHFSQARGGIHLLTNHDCWTRVGTVVSPVSGVYDLGLQTTQIGNTASMEVTRTCTGFEFYFHNGSGTSGFQIWIDGSNVETIVTSQVGGRRPDGFWYQGPLTRGAHTLKMVATGNGTFINSVYAVDDDSGVGPRVYNAGKSSAHSVNFANGSGFNQNMARISRLDPALIIIALGANDYGSNVSPASYKGNLNETIQWIKMVTGPMTSILLVHKYRRLDISSPTYPITDYQRVMREVAAATSDCDFLDISPHFPATQKGDFYGFIDKADLVHPTPSGHSLIADLVADHLLKPTSARSAPLSTGATITTTAPSALSGVLSAWRGSDLGTVGSFPSSWATYAGTNTQALAQANGTNQGQVNAEADSINGRKYLFMENQGTAVAGDFMQTTAWAAKQNPPLTIAMVCRRRKNLGHLFSGRTSGAYVTMYADQGDSEMLGWAAAGSLSSPAPAGFWVGTGAWNVYCLVVNGATSKFFQNGRGVQDFTMSTVAQNAAAGLQGFTLGGRYDGVNSGDMDVAEVIIYNRALSDSEAQGVVDYWARDYGLDLANRTSAAA